MSDITLTLTAAKKHAVRLQQLFAKKQIQLTHSESLEALATVFGKQNWHEFEQLFKTDSKPKSHASPLYIEMNYTKKNSTDTVSTLKSIVKTFLSSHTHKTLRIEPLPQSNKLVITTNLDTQTQEGSWSDMVEFMSSMNIYPLSFNPLPVCRQTTIPVEQDLINVTIQITTDYKIIMYKSSMHILNLKDMQGLDTNRSIFLNNTCQSNLFIISNPGEESDKLAAQLPDLILKSAIDPSNKPIWFKSYDTNLITNINTYLDTQLLNQSRVSLPMHTFLHTRMNIGDLLQYLYKNLSLDRFLLFVKNISNRTFIVETCLLALNEGSLPVVNIAHVLNGFTAEAANISPERMPQLIHYSLERSREFTMSGLVETIDKKYNQE